MGQANVGHGVVKRLDVRRYAAERDHPTLESWWRGHGSRAPNPRFLPTTGFVIDCDGVPVCAGFVYHTDSKLCVFEFVVCDPAANKENRSLCLNALIETVKVWSKVNNYEFIYSCANMVRYRKRLEESGFLAADGGQQHFLYEVK